MVCGNEEQANKVTSLAGTTDEINPALIEEGKNPFSLDSKEPDWSKFHDFLLGEVRYLSVKKAYPNEAEELFAEAQKIAQLRYKSYIRKAAEDWSE